MTASRFAEIALPLPLFQTFTYAIDREPANPLVAGARVVVPVRNKRAIGVCVGTSDHASVAHPRALLDVPDPVPAISSTMLALCRWMSDYYVVPPGIVLRAVLPALLTGAGRPKPASKTERIAVVRDHLPSLEQREQRFGRAHKQRELFELLESLGGTAAVAHLIGRLGFSSAVLTGLVGRGLIGIEERTVTRDPFAMRARLAADQHERTTSQRAAIAALIAARAGDVFLLHGITGSGKTLVYIELLKEIVGRRGKSAIVLVPEIALTPQTVDRFRAVFGDRVAVLHSALSDGERYDAWLSLQRGEKRIAVGARSAIFAPLSNVGAIIVDEEHEGSYKSGETPRYHAREVAVVRAGEEGAVVVLGSATPSLESWHNAERGKYRLLTLPERVGAGRLPAVDVVDLRTNAQGGMKENAESGIGKNATERSTEFRFPHSAFTSQHSAFASVISPSLENALVDRLERGEQSILLLNRRGYASFIQCRECGDVAVCPNCSITLTYHRAPERLVCHYCLHQEALAATCRRCGGTTLRQRGIGTQQVERVLSERFPAARIARMDVDTTSGKWAHAEILDRVGRGEVEILLGTQMIAKGLDFPNVTLVGVVDADVGINLPDFRASERSFQLLSQVAGRAGRGPKGGQVIIQTRAPSHHAVRCAVIHDYRAFVREELPGRRNPPYPPFVRVANVVFSGVAEDPVAELAITAADELRRLIATRPALGVTVIGAAPCPIERIRQRWRWHALLKTERPASLTHLGRHFMERFEVPTTAGLRIAFDRDPVSLL